MTSLEAPEIKPFLQIPDGIPQSVCIIGSFSADKVLSGFAACVFGCYRLSRVLSLEAQVAYVKAGMSVRACCVKSSYWWGRLRTDVSVEDMGTGKVLAFIVPPFSS